MSPSFRKPASSIDQGYNPYSKPLPPLEPELATGIWAMDPFIECDFMADYYASDSLPEVFGRSLTDAVEEAPPGSVVEPDPVIMGLPDSPASDEVGDQVQIMTMWMRIEEEKKRRGQESASSDQNGNPASSS